MWLEKGLLAFIECNMPGGRLQRQGREIFSTRCNPLNKRIVANDGVPLFPTALNSRKPWRVAGGRIKKSNAARLSGKSTLRTIRYSRV